VDSSSRLAASSSSNSSGSSMKVLAAIGEVACDGGMVLGSRLAARTLRSSMITETSAGETEADARDAVQGFYGAGGLSAAICTVVWSGTLRRVQQGRWFCMGSTATVSVDMVRNSSEHCW
jgi:hypothetical protein